MCCAGYHIEADMCCPPMQYMLYVRCDGNNLHLKYIYHIHEELVCTTCPAPTRRLQLFPCGHACLHGGKDAHVCINCKQAPSGWSTLPP
eukprot:139449-Prorocentrum_minimum.AAC.9